MVCSGQLSPEPRWATKNDGESSRAPIVKGPLSPGLFPGAAMAPVVTNSWAADAAGTTAGRGRAVAPGAGPPGQAEQPATPSTAPAAAMPRNCRRAIMMGPVPAPSRRGPGPAQVWTVHARTARRWMPRGRVRAWIPHAAPWPHRWQ